MLKTLNYWLPPLAWMMLIFILSSQHRIGITSEYVIDFLIFKSLHMIEYGVLFMFLLRAFHKTTALPLHKLLLYTFVIAVAYGGLDEIHQTFVPTREGTVRDVLFDTTGVFLSFWFVKKYFTRLQKYL